METPVLLIIFNRPDKVKRLIEALSLVKPTQIYISADGPRDHVPSDIVKCKTAREITKKINWPCEIHTNFLFKNLGVDRGMEEAMSWDKAYTNFCDKTVPSGISDYDTYAQWLTYNHPDKVIMKPFYNKSMKRTYFFDNKIDMLALGKKVRTLSLHSYN